ncbi:MAG: AAA family ATPase [Bacteroidia bacterium]|nr:AAA family ATPase [Bacteroidia bacterium]
MKNLSDNKVKSKRNSNQREVIFSSVNHTKMYAGNRFIQPFQMFYEINKEVCNRIIFYNTNYEKLFSALIEKYQLNEKQIISTKGYSKKQKSFFFTSYLIPITKNLWVFYGSGDNEQEGVTILHSYSVEKIDLMILQDTIMSFENVDSTTGKIYLIHKYDYGFDLKSYEVKDTECDIKTNYNDDFEEIDTKIITRLNTPNDKGLVLLHGKPGTGKTSYIRYLTKKVNKKMIFLSPEVSQYISSPEFITILSEYPNSIIIIEDAENVIKTRKSGGSSAISNLLNLTDGLLADCLKIQLICSFNTDVSQIDKALLRKGRLIAMYEFKELKQQKASNLAISLGKVLPINTDATLADIFNVEEPGAQLEVFAKIGY